MREEIEMTMAHKTDSSTLMRLVSATLLCSAILLAGCGAKDEGEAAPTMVAVQAAGVCGESVHPAQSLGRRDFISAGSGGDRAEDQRAGEEVLRERDGSAVHAGELLAELESADLAGGGGSRQTRGGYAQAQAQRTTPRCKKRKQDVDYAKQVRHVSSSGY